MSMAIESILGVNSQPEPEYDGNVDNVEHDGVTEENGRYSGGTSQEESADVVALGNEIALSVVKTTVDIVNSDTDFKAAVLDLYRELGERPDYDTVTFEKAIRYIFANLDKDGRLNGADLINTNEIDEGKAIRKKMTSVLKSIRERNRYEHNVDVIAMWKSEIPGFEYKLGIPDNLYGAAHIAKVIHELSKKHSVDPFGERENIIRALSDATSRGERRIVQRIAKLRGVSPEMIIGRQLRLRERLTYAVTDKQSRLRRVLYTSVVGIVAGVSLYPLLGQVIRRKVDKKKSIISTPIPSITSSYSPPQRPYIQPVPEPMTGSDALSQEKDHSRSLRTGSVTTIKRNTPPIIVDHISPPKVVKTHGQEGIPIIDEEEKTLPEKFRLESVTEVRYLPPESYLQEGEMKMIIPKEIIIHWDAQPNSNTSTSKTYNGLVGRTRSGDPVSTHFSVGDDSVLQMLPMETERVAMGILSDGPSEAINIETTGRYYDETPPPEEQTRNLVYLTVELMQKYNLRFKNVTGHLERSPDIGKIDPGQGYLNDVRIRVLRTLIKRGAWKLIGDPGEWNFHKVVRDKRTGALVECTTQSSEEILTAIPPYERAILERELSRHSTDNAQSSTIQTVRLVNQSHMR